MTSKQVLSTPLDGIDDTLSVPMLSSAIFDIHSHILPGLDDGATDIGVSVQMAKAYVDQGVACVACTPHVLPGVYQNSGRAIREAVVALSNHLLEGDIPLHLVTGADNHMTVDFVQRLREGSLLTLADTPYVLVEPPHHTAPFRLEAFFFELQAAGYLPILTHPERLSWIESSYATIQQLAWRGAWLQITSGSLRGAFGRRPQYWAERMLADGIVHVVASDAHNMAERRPDLAEGLRAVEILVGNSEAQHMFVTRPRGIVFGVSPDALPRSLRWSADDEMPYFQDGSRPVSRGGVRDFISRLRGIFAR